MNFEKTILTSELIDQYLALNKCMQACLACKNYNTIWACPPFDFDPLQKIRKHKYASILARRIDLPGNLPLADAASFIEPAKQEIERELLDREKRLGGFSCGLGGGCKLCSPCLRTLGAPCAHPDKVRPELEAFGFDIAPIIASLFGLEFAWGKDGLAPPYLLLVTAHFHS